MTKKQWFLFFNFVVIAAMFLTGNLKLTTKSIVSNLIALIAGNIATLFGARRVTDWKK